MRNIKTINDFGRLKTERDDAPFVFLITVPNIVKSREWRKT
ncbi:hypothetical protein CEV34_5110 [Brucella pseudogrignonensis]|uniref:Uncharacterized protein n=1 Tax=Brucella pseudogrignonensis TaxID=419475 RepID=A0A256G2S0_9HYPH|nr:hypothetical protein CEV34_5110 [Brucella pseudogrignonensis]